MKHLGACTEVYLLSLLPIPYEQLAAIGSGVANAAEEILQKIIMNPHTYLTVIEPREAPRRFEGFCYY
ncbi:uncharacterized protein LAJ45_02131 [Morchella importuna]|uniref:uncharacterized protein n=1 Tax=Morchella importuna TaxID=1174673 RepID=UPI001E8E7AC0|nr:uncharacterized protein LAJ45_02131 [Morchella importuna]KAH8154363.1 hypothetical protein LAJ45_02131 [Morchella importuna]